MKFDKLPVVENVVRVIFPQTMMNEGELLPAVFKLRERSDGPEKYISVFRQYAESFCNDILAFDKQRNLPCCIMNVGDLTEIGLTIHENEVKFEVVPIPTDKYQSHAGIYTFLGDLLVEGNGKNAFSALKIGEESKYYLIAIRRRLLEIAKKRIAQISQIVNAE